jgi:hypothetical protein
MLKRVVDVLCCVVVCSLNGLVGTISDSVILFLRSDGVISLGANVHVDGDACRSYTCCREHRRKDLSKFWATALMARKRIPS